MLGFMKPLYSIVNGCSFLPAISFFQTGCQTWLVALATSCFHIFFLLLICCLCILNILAIIFFYCLFDGYLNMAMTLDGPPKIEDHSVNWFLTRKATVQLKFITDYIIMYGENVMGDDSARMMLDVLEG